ncbi:MAG: ifcA [Clostridia bacterium]|nr:ifcA [Clostridia bacterium]
MKKFNKSIAMLLALIMIFALVGCQKSEPTSAASLFKSGTYTGEAEGIHGKVQVEVTVDENKILEVKIVKHTETPGVSDLAIQNVPADILKYQTLAVDTVAGASVTSNAIIAAVTQALEKAGAKIEDLQKKPEQVAKSGEIIEKQADVIIVGAGGAGLAAAVTAHQKGATVVVIEKMPKAGGNTILSGGAFNAADPSRQAKQGIEDSAEKHYTQTFEGGDKLGKPELVKTLTENAYPAIQWLEGLGMEFKSEVFTVLGGLWPRAHKPVKPLGTGFIDTYLSYVEKNSNGIEIMYETKALEIIMENGKAVGVKAEGKDANVVLKANKGVIVAAGGFGANVEMRDANNKTWPTLTTIKTTNHVGATGDGMIMAEKIGANLIGMDNIQLLPMGDPLTGSLSGNIEQGVENRIFVNKDGNRFVDEGQRRDVMTKALFEQKDTSMWVIVDKHSYPTGDVKNNFNETIDELVAAGRAYKADTLEDLAKQIGANPENLVKAVAEFNKAVEKGGKDALGRTLFKDKLDAPPYYAGARVPTVHHTMGGIEINTSAQVLDKDGKIIPGLYAAGETTGGVHGSNRLGGNALADMTVFGRIAGESAAAGK